MNAPTTNITFTIIFNNGNGPLTKVADAELHFAGGPLAGLKLIGFAVWRSRIGDARVVTVPARQSYVNRELHACALLRPIDAHDQNAYEPIRALILAACRMVEAAASETPPEHLVRETLQPTHRLTDEPAIELTKDITVVMAAEKLNPRDAWRLIVARLGVGPCFVQRVAAHMRDAGINVTIEGTEHVHYTIDAPSSDAVSHSTAAALRQTFPPSVDGYSWEWSPIASPTSVLTTAPAEHRSPRTTPPDEDRPR